MVLGDEVSLTTFRFIKIYFTINNFSKHSFVTPKIFRIERKRNKETKMNNYENEINYPIINYRSG